MLATVARFHSTPTFAAALFCSASLVFAQSSPISIPNHSFESPTVPTGFPVNIVIDSWQKPPQPSGFDPANYGGITWEQTSGVFPNPPPSSPANHIDNIDGAQAAYLFAIPDVALFQTLSSPDGLFESGKAYRVTAGIIGGSGMPEGTILQLALYYTGPLNERIPIVFNDITYSAAAFPNITHLSAYEVDLPVVQASDPWAGKAIGIQFLSTSLGGTYWDIDNVRLVSSPVPEPASTLFLGLAAISLTLRRCHRIRK